jgi:ATP-dependent Clp protease protease subunit
LYAHHTGKSIDQIERDMDRDRFMSADEAKEYGIIDNVLSLSSFPKLNGDKKD